VLTPTEPSDLYPDGGTPEQPYPPEFTAALDPIVTLTVAATVTSTVRLGSSTLTATWHNPLLLARSLTTLDQVSRGRLDAGFGISWSHDEYHAVGVPWRGRGARLDEILDVLDTLWTATVVQHTGPLFTLPPSTVDLRPVQDGGPPVLLGGFGPTALKRVGRRAAGWLGLHGMPDDYAEMLWQIARAAADEAGRDPDALRRDVRVNAHPGQTVGALRDIAADLQERGVDGAFYDLTYLARSVDESLDLAAALAPERRANQPGPPAG
jgi:probable F420-dependent oxidoreductase